MRRMNFKICEFCLNFKKNYWETSEKRTRSACTSFLSLDLTGMNCQATAVSNLRFSVHALSPHGQYPSLASMSQLWGPQAALGWAARGGAVPPSNRRLFLLHLVTRLPRTHKGLDAHCHRSQRAGARAAAKERGQGGQWKGKRLGGH